MDGNDGRGTPVTSGGEDNPSFSSTGTASEDDVTAYGDNSGTPVTAGGDQSALAQDGGTPVTAGGDG